MHNFAELPPSSLPSPGRHSREASPTLPPPPSHFLHPFSGRGGGRGKGSAISPYLQNAPLEDFHFESRFDFPFGVQIKRCISPRLQLQTSHALAEAAALAAPPLWRSFGGTEELPWFWRSQHQMELLAMPNCGLPSEAEGGESSRVWEAGPPTSDTSLWSRRTAEISAWSALGDSNWWLMFIDGRAHGKGVHAWDKADDELKVNTLY